MPKMDKYEGATAGRVLNFDENEMIRFPATFRQALGTKRGLMVLVYKDRQVRIFPLESDNVQYLSIVIGKLTNDFLTELSRTFKKYGLVDLLYSTGVCLRGTRCFYECYFSPDQLTEPVEELEKSLKNLEGVDEVVIEPVPS